MPHGPTYFPSKGACIYCGVTGIRLTDEHIMPYSLGGQHVIREASCLKCADMTKKFEQRVARDLWGDARASYGAPTRRKKERKSHITYRDPDDPNKKWSVPVNEFPGGFVFYKMGKAGLLQGLPEAVDLSGMWQMDVASDDVRREEFHARNPGKLVLSFRHVPDAFGRLIAKVGYGQVLSVLDPGDFHPICLPYITGQRENVSFVVGGTLDSQPPTPGIGYSLGISGFGSSVRLLLIALVRFYANMSSPAYHVVVGDVNGEAAVSRVVQKIGPMEIALPNLPNTSLQSEHWEPEVMPLPFWI